MEDTSGAEGSIGSGYISLWPAEKIEELNEQYAVEQFAPGLVLFASDGGDTGYAFDTRTVPPVIVATPLIGMSLKVAQPKAYGFGDFLQRLAAE